MKLSLIVITAILLSLTANAQNKVIYGSNGLRTPRQIPIFPDLFDATAGLVANYRLQDADDHYKLLTKKTKFCAGEVLNNQARLAKCTGFLIADDIIITAGHCVADQIECSNNSWVFDFTAEVAQQGTISKDSVYKCSKVIYSEKNMQTKADFAIIRLARKVEGRVPMYLNKGELEIDEHLMTLGFPFGTFLKLSINGTIRNNSNPYFFSANLDTFHGNSGAPVVNQNSGDVEGVLVRGESDTYFDDVKNCVRIKHCEDDSCRGEDVIRISNVIDKLQELGIKF